jgi:hypothetical protein
MKRLKMIAVVPTAGMSILAPDMKDGAPPMKANGPVDFICSGCDRVLAKSVPENFGETLRGTTPEGVVIRCICGAHSMFPKPKHLS